jgi:hypothetical protein
MQTLKTADRVTVDKTTREIVHQWACPSLDGTTARATSARAELVTRHNPESKTFASRLRLVQVEQRDGHTVTTWSYGDPSCRILAEHAPRYGFARLEDFAERSLHILHDAFADSRHPVMECFGTDGACVEEGA